jgi:hypothetical protein
MRWPRRAWPSIRALLAHVDFDQPEIGPQLLWDTIDRMLRLDPIRRPCCAAATTRWR